MAKIHEKVNPSNQTAKIDAEIYTIPQNECVLEQKVPTKYMSDSYFQDIVHDKENNKNILTIKNKEGDILCEIDL